MILDTNNFLKQDEICFDVRLWS